MAFPLHSPPSLFKHTFFLAGSVLLGAMAVPHVVSLVGEARAGTFAPAPQARLAPVNAQQVRPHALTTQAGGTVELAILLDTSSSMSGLIDQARAQLWRIVNEMGTARRGGELPNLRIAVYEYGNSGLDPAAGWIRRVVPFTDDLDSVSEALFALRTGGGDEYCGQAIDTAIDQLDWSRDPSTLKLIYIAGNEPFTQGPVDFRAALNKANEAGVIVNPIHCGGEEQGAAGMWAEAAVLGHGRYLAIDHNRKVEHIAAPQDAEIARLGTALNETYVAYGSKGRRGMANQVAQDNNAMSYGAGSSVQRAVAKSSGMYSNWSWDLVDAVVDGRVALKDVERGTLPGELEGLSGAALKKALDAKRGERASIQAKIKRLNVDRERFVAAERAKRADGGALTLDDAVLATIRAQAAAVGYEFE
jgi:hypothetical protein